MFRPNERQCAILAFLDHHEGLYSAVDISQAIGSNLSTAFRTDLNILLAAGRILRQPVSSDANRLAWGYTIAHRMPPLEI